MDASEADEDSPFTARDAKLHVEICRKLSANVCKIVEIFPVLEAARPRSKTGIQSLCSVHVALDKAKNLLQHCSNCSKLYLAITGDSILVKFDKASCALKESLIQVVDIVPEEIGCQIVEIVGELEETTFTLDEVEKQAGDEIIQLLQKENKFDNENITDCEELEIFHQAVTQLGIATSSRAALTERRALKKLIERARAEEDKRKESIVTYLLHLMRKYSKFFRSEISDDTDSQCSSPCSPTITPGHGNGHAFERQLSKLSSFNFKPTGLRSGSIPVPPEEFRCPISLQLMYDPVIISSGQTYERTCIEKWFNDGHHTCPKTQQHLLHSCLTPNYCVKALIGSWCQQNKLPLPIAPPSSLDLNYWRLALGSEQEIILLDSKSMDSRVVPIDKKSEEIVVNSEDFEEDDLFVRYEKLLYVLYNGKNGKEQHDAVEQIRLLLKDNDEARAYMGANGFIDGLFLFLRSAIEEGDENSQAVATMALFNLSVNNSRNKRLMLSAGVITLLEEMMLTSTAYEAAVALYLNLSCLDNAKPVIGSSKVVPFLVKLLRLENCKPQCRADSLHTLYNISNYAPNINSLLCAGIVNSLHTLITRSSVSEEKKIGWAEKSIAVLINLASNKLGRRDIISTPGLVSDIAKALDTDDPVQQEQAIYCLLQLCNEDPTCCNMVLQEGVIPALVLVSATGTPRGKEKAQKLLMLFREIRQSESSPEKHRMEINRDNVAATTMEGKYLVKSPPKRTSRSVRRRLTAIWKRKYFSLYQCVGD